MFALVLFSILQRCCFTVFWLVFFLSWNDVICIFVPWDIMCLFTLSDVKIFSLLLVLNTSVQCTSVCFFLCYLYSDILGFLNLRTYSFHQIWKIFLPLILKYFCSLCPFLHLSDHTHTEHTLELLKLFDHTDTLVCLLICIFLSVLHFE